MAISTGTNAGVHNATGLDFQKHCALYLLLESFESIKNKTYFICLEHHDDVLFCFLDNNKVSLIDTYQAKKASSTWGFSAEFFEIIKKITENGIRLINDSIAKTSTYSHNLHFATNHSIKLISKQKKPKSDITCIINDSNILVEYKNLDTVLQKRLKDELSKLTKDTSQIAELGKVSLRYIDLAKQSSSQKDQLIGSFSSLYNVLKQNNEQKSAELAARRLKNIGFPENEIARCTQFILATQHHQPADVEINLFTDADLAILGARAHTYQQYAAQIRKEYSIYPDLIYNPGRKKVLNHFLDMTHIFKTDVFRSRFEAQARVNLQWELKVLS